MSHYEEYPELEPILVEFEESWTAPNPRRIVELIQTDRPPSIPIHILLGELLNIEFDMTSLHDEVPNAANYIQLITGHDPVIWACVGAWVLRTLEAKLAEGQIVEVESIASEVDFGINNNEALLDLLEEEHRLRLNYEIATREKEYEANYSELWPILKERLLAAKMLGEDVLMLPSQPMVRLRVLTGPHQGEDFHYIEHDSFVVGRGSRCRLRLADDPYFSRYHFRIEINPPECQLIDLESRNGTYVNGMQVPEAALRHGDQVSAGQTTILVHVQGENGAPILPTVDPTQTWSNDSSHLLVGQQEESKVPDVVIDPEATPLRVPAFREQPTDEPLPPPVPTDLPSSKTSTGDPNGIDHNATGAAIPSEGKEALAVPGYEIREPIYSDPSKSVYRGVQTRSGDSVAIKFYRSIRGFDASAMKSILDSEAAYRRLEHRRVARVLEIGRIGTELFIVSQYVRHITAEDAWAHKPLKDRIRLACGVVCFALEAVEVGHRSNWIHGNLNPNNILIVKNQNKIGGRLTDYGVALQLQRAGLATVLRTGQDDHSLSFQAPERLLEIRSVTTLGDIYSIGATLFQFLTGRPPIETLSVASSMASILNQGVTSVSNLVPEIPEGLAKVVDKALRTEPSERFLNAADFYKHLYPFTRKS